MCSWWNSESVAELRAELWRSQSSTQHLPLLPDFTEHLESELHSFLMELPVAIQPLVGNSHQWRLVLRQQTALGWRLGCRSAGLSGNSPNHHWLWLWSQPGARDSVNGYFPRGPPPIPSPSSYGRRRAFMPWSMPVEAKLLSLPWTHRDTVPSAPKEPSRHPASSWLSAGLRQVPSFFLRFPPKPLFSHPQHAGSAGPGPSRLGVSTERPGPSLAGLAGQHSPARPSLLGAGEPVPLGGHRPSLLSNYSIAGLRLCLIVCVL